MKALLLFLLPLLLCTVMTAQADPAAQKTVTPDEAEKLLKTQPGVTVLDVRTPEEFAKGHIAGAKNVDFYDSKFASELKAMDKAKPYVLHCAAGGRSAKAAKMMEAEKFQQVYHLSEGFNGWEKAGKPVEK